MAYEMVMPYHLHMPSYFLETFTEYPYVVPARELYDYDKDTRRITFPIKETEKEKMSRLERFKKKDNRCLLYIK